MFTVDVKWLQENGKYKCPFCSKKYSKKGISTNILRTHTNKDLFENSSTKGMSWKASEEGRENCKKAQQERFEKINGKKKEYEVICHTCGKMFSVIERKRLHPEKEKYFCSRSCANTREHTDKMKKKGLKMKNGNVYRITNRFNTRKIIIRCINDEHFSVETLEIIKTNSPNANQSKWYIDPTVWNFENVSKEDHPEYYL